MYKDYVVWWKPFADEWRKTTNIIRARTDKEAQSKMRRRYKDSGFSGMSLVAVEDGQQPSF